MAKLSFLNLLLIALCGQTLAVKLGGYKPISKTDKNLLDAANYAVVKVDEQTNTNAVLKLVDVISAKYQIVAGTNYAITLRAQFTACKKTENYDLKNCELLTDVDGVQCEVVVYKKFNGTYSLTSNTCKNSKIGKLVQNIKLNTGSWESVNPSDVGIKNAAAYFISFYSNGINSMYALKMVRVWSANQQVVAGMKYRFKISAGFTKCRKTPGKLDLTNCEWSENQKEAFECDVQVYVSLSDTIEVTEHKCSKKSLDDLLLETKPAFMPGGWKDLKRNDTKVVKLAENAIEKISLQADKYSQFKLIEVIKVAYQVVAGLKYRLTFDLGETDCLRRANGLQKPLKECNLLNETHAVRCNVTIVTTPWLNKTKIEIEKPCKLAVISSLKQNEFMKKNKMAFEVFKKKYSKTYESLEEESKRFKIFMENQKIIKTLNKFEKGTATYGNTMHVDQTGDEFEAKYLGLKPSLAKGLKMKEAKIPDGPIPASFDWREKKVVTEVKNQGSCGSCWAFSTTGNIEGQWAIKKKSLVSLSEQELVDCDKVDQGCNGGLPSQAYKQIIKLGGLETEAEYPYEGVGEKCSFIQKKSKVYINDSVAVSTNETKMAQWLVKNGPISIGINAMAMQFYFGGVSHPWSIFCNPRSLDHGVLIVGYGVTKSSILKRTLPYWIVKNSWGKSWGEQGYYRVYRGDGTCGLNRMPTSAIIN